MTSTDSNIAVQGQGERPLWIALILTSAFLIAEVIGGILTNSLALISDAAHMFTDSAALAVSLAAIRIGRRPADGKRTFGYYRFEILAAAFNAILLFLVAMYIIYEAYQRLSEPAEIESMTMLAVAALGLVVNLISMRLLTKDKDESLNIKGAYLEVWSDMLGSIGVIVGAVVIKLTGWSWVDSVIAVAIGLWVLPRTWTLLKESVNVLLEGVPEGLGVDDIKKVLLAVDGIFNVHELHVWSISSGKASLTVHLASTHPPERWPLLTDEIRRLLGEKFSIFHATIQLENSVCEQGVAEHSYASSSLQQSAESPSAIVPDGDAARSDGKSL
ncbi:MULTISPECIES: cation diffusion facilitator family transporter [Massilia]|uniref:cation diffusion facilitator family transporter n=1 Tax=Massilia TaxID=149698 RepID=UPI000912C4A0|nr:MULTISPECIES: cation diffusion facilitator family transporter [Massilia]SHG76219.1 cobalt-zinc-cadmium efflux system protein [Massilia sp. CF038]